MVFAQALGRWVDISKINPFPINIFFHDVRWEIVFTDNGTLLAYTNTTQLPLGLHTWHFEEGADCGDMSSRELLLHRTLPQPGHFCCGDGSCISSELVCDNNQHCEDRSLMNSW